MGGITYLYTAIQSAFDKHITPNTNKYSLESLAFFSNVLGLLTMIGALSAEFMLRTEPKWLLVYIAIGIIILSGLNLWIIRNSINTNVNKS